jgi:hypothetical protein
MIVDLLVAEEQGKTRIVDAKVVVCYPAHNFVTLKIVTQDGIAALADAKINRQTPRHDALPVKNLNQLLQAFDASGGHEMVACAEQRKSANVLGQPDMDLGQNVVLNEKENPR